MNSEFSFKYVFFDLLALIENISIEYAHNPSITRFETLESDGELIDGVKWELKVLSFSDEKPWLFEKELTKVMESTRVNLELNRLELLRFYEVFITQLTNRQSAFEQLEKGAANLKALHDKGIVKLDYKGDLPCDEVEVAAMQNGVLEPNFDEFAYDEIYRLTASNFKVLIKSLKKLISYLGHEVNLATTQQEQLNNQKEDNEYINLFKLGKIKDLFNQLNADEKYKLDRDIILLSSRFHTLEKDKNNDTIKREDYEYQKAKILNFLLDIITQ